MSEMNQEFLDKLLSGQYSDEGDEPAGIPDEQIEPEPLPDTSLPILKRNAELVDLPISCLVDYPDQPLPPYSEVELVELLDSIRENGIIEPLIVRPYGELYQIISGRNRKNAAVKLGYQAVPCVIRNLNDDDAAIQLVETIFQQRDMSKVSIMQKAHAYRLWLDAMNRQGRRSDLTSCQVDAKFRSDEKIAESAPESARTIQRLIRLTYLITELQDKVDDNKSSFPLIAAVLISYLSSDNQTAVHQFFFVDNTFDISIKMAERLRDDDKAGVVFDQEALHELWGELNENKPASGKVRKLVLPSKELKFFYKAGYFKEDSTEKEMFANIREWADYYYKNKGLENTKGLCKQ